MKGLTKFLIVVVPAFLIVLGAYFFEFGIQGCWAARGTERYGMCGLFTGISFIPAVVWILLSIIVLAIISHAQDKNK